MDILIPYHYSMLTTTCITINSIVTKCFPLDKINSENMEDDEFVLKNPIPYLMFSSAVLMKFWNRGVNAAISIRNILMDYIHSGFNVDSRHCKYLKVVPLVTTASC
ncbi:hypothetical protein K501DRAFT_270171 [Backusella circina FSU 941]|nr:hypothetical protein K501DRAFT_270171 [Backusella circina FSU 941]